MNDAAARSHTSFILRRFHLRDTGSGRMLADSDTFGPEKQPELRQRDLTIP